MDKLHARLSISEVEKDSTNEKPVVTCHVVQCLNVGCGYEFLIGLLSVSNDSEVSGALVIE